MNLLTSYIPDARVFSSKNSNFTVIDRLGDAVIRNVVKSILCGGNLRDLTEAMTRKRILSSNAALLVMYFRLLRERQDIETELTRLVDAELALPTKRVSAEKKDLLLSLIGMTRKGWDNIVRRELGKTAYLQKLDQSLKELERDICEEYGTFEAQLDIGGEKRTLPTISLLRCMMAIGSQTLAIRGSEKSIYGKLFERLILGSVLTILGFRKIDRSDFSDTSMVFWLSDPKNKRECDATAIITPGLCVRFDIGFIGRGNPEISLDKVTRYDHFLDLESKSGRKSRASSHTIIIVDTIGEGSRVREMAAEIGGAVIQMNSSFWVKELADTIERIYPRNFKNPLKSISQRDSLPFIGYGIASVPFEHFLPGKHLANKNSETQPVVEVLADVAENLRYKSYLPLYSFKAACGPLSEGAEAHVEGWIKVTGHGRLDDSHYVVRTEGVSMEGLIPNGSLCIMRKLGAGDMNGKTLLVQRNDASDPEDGGAYTIKTFIRKNGKVILKAKNPDYDICLEDDGEYSMKYRAVGEFESIL